MALLPPGAQLFAEPFASPEVYCSGVGAVHLIGGGAACLVLYRNTFRLEQNGGMHPRIVASVIMPVETVPDAVQQMVAAIGQSPVPPAQMNRPAPTATSRSGAVGTEEYFATGMTIQSEPEFVRLLFFSDRSAVSVVVPPATFNRMAAAIAIGPDRMVN